jgi:putative SOS response-associated peptidase YedK
MCGRFTLASPGAIVAELFGLAAAPALVPRYNIAPSQAVAVVRGGSGGHSFAELHWGLIPSWSKDAAIGNKMINARGETLAEKPAFRSAYRSRRCLILADGFFEWATGPGRKQPWYFRSRDRRPFAFAGLWERWKGADGDAVESCTIVTTTASELVAPVHDRMPVILDPESLEAWLDTGGRPGDTVDALLRPCPAERLEAYPVSFAVNSPANDSPACIAPLS